MTYEDLVAYCSRAIGMAPGQSAKLTEIVGALMAHGPGNRAIAAETLARFMAEFIEYDRPQKTRMH